MVDIFALVLSHGLLVIAAWRLLWRPDLDQEGAVPEPRPHRRTMRTMRPGQDEVRAADPQGDSGGDA